MIKILFKITLQLSHKYQLFKLIKIDIDDSQIIEVFIKFSLNIQGN